MDETQLVVLVHSKLLKALKHLCTNKVVRPRDLFTLASLSGNEPPPPDSYRTSAHGWTHGRTHGRTHYS
jgi:hypothetical protein